MNDLLSITANDEKLTLSARALHKELQATERFSYWFRRFSDYGFEENVDYVGCKEFNTLAKQELQDYQITIDMAKEIAMLQRNEKGKEIRKKLIELENAWNSPEKVMARALDIAHKTIADLQVRNEQMKPKALFADTVSGSEGGMLVGQVAKLISQGGYPIGQNRFFKWLRDNGYLCKRGDNYNMPTQKSREMNLFDIKVRTVTNADGSVRETRTPIITGKGQIYFVNKLCGE